MGAVQTARSYVYNQWTHHPAVDFALTALPVGVLAATQGHHILADHDADQRMNIYATVASVAAIVGGFGTAAISQYATSAGRRMTILRQMYGVHLRRNWVGLLTSMLLVSFGCLAVMMSDTDKTIGLGGWITEYLIFFGAVRSLRLIWLFRLLIDVSDHDAENPNSDTRVQVRRVNR
ncbi:MULTISPECIES: hypothetical protein [unclassified Streptomyces]|uniref:hypothetical protein n=1 Tax=unclassified Streptomyces TaxID=2593676 RepID=UPI00131B3395|nr:MULTISPECIES: hypothetical protein [unclassified Streptomyces]MYX24919.1 hypothetical protein [Streptomyces sp. SID8380]